MIPPCPDVYEFRVQGALSPDWSDWLDGLLIESQSQDCTILKGPVTDQAALHGLLAKMRDLNLTLLAIQKLPTPRSNDLSANSESRD